MRITIEPTDEIISLDVGGGGEVPARIWRGTTEDGTEVSALIICIMAKDGEHDEELFRRQLIAIKF